MAKKTKTAEDASEPEWIQCEGFTLDVRLSSEDFTFKLIVGDNDYSLKHQKATPELIKRVLRVIAGHWPEPDWDFQADDKGTITDVR
jgi:hypothetical protein